MGTQQSPAELTLFGLWCSHTKTPLTGASPNSGARLVFVRTHVRTCIRSIGPVQTGGYGRGSLPGRTNFNHDWAFCVRTADRVFTDPLSRVPCEWDGGAPVVEVPHDWLLAAVPFGDTFQP